MRSAKAWSVAPIAQAWHQRVRVKPAHNTRTRCRVFAQPTPIGDASRQAPHHFAHAKGTNTMAGNCGGAQRRNYLASRAHHTEGREGQRLLRGQLGQARWLTNNGARRPRNAIFGFPRLRPQDDHDKERCASSHYFTRWRPPCGMPNPPAALQ